VVITRSPTRAGSVSALMISRETAHANPNAATQVNPPLTEEEVKLRRSASISGCCASLGKVSKYETATVESVPGPSTQWMLLQFISGTRRKRVSYRKPKVTSLRNVIASAPLVTRATLVVLTTPSKPRLWGNRSDWIGGVR
jgi:hypothetical protein